MVKSVLSVSQRGLREWIIQRLSAIVMAIYSIFLITYVLMHPGLSYLDWYSLFAMTGMKVFSVIFLLALLYHAWIGVWTIFTDYVKPFVLRAVLNSLVLFMLFACFFWGIMILWSV